MALVAEGENPVVVTFAGFAAGFSRYCDVFNAAEVGGEVDCGEEGGAGDVAAFDWVGEEEGDAVVGDFLRFDGAADVYVVVAVAPIGRQGDFEAVDSLCQHEEFEVGAALYHCPRFRAPLVGLGNEKIRSKACGYDFPALYFGRTFRILLERLIKIGSLFNFILSMPF